MFGNDTLLGSKTLVFLKSGSMGQIRHQEPKSVGKSRRTRHFQRRFQLQIRLRTMPLGANMWLQISSPRIAGCSGLKSSLAVLRPIPARLRPSPATVEPRTNFTAWRFTQVVSMKEEE